MFMTAAKKPLTLHQLQGNPNIRQQYETEQKTNFQDFHTYLQSVTKSQNSPLEYTLNEHSDDNVQVRGSNTSGRILEAQVSSPIQQVLPQQQQVIEQKIISLQSGASEERKIVTKQSSMVSSKQISNATESKSEGSRLISANIFESGQPQQTSHGLPPKPVSIKDKPKEVSRNRLTQEEAQRLTSNNPPPGVIHNISLQSPDKQINQTPVQSLQREQAPVYYPISPPVKHINPQIQPPTYQKHEIINTQQVNPVQNLQSSQSQDMTAKFYQSEHEQFLQNSNAQYVPHQVVQNIQLSQTAQPTIFIQKAPEQPKAPVKIEPVLLPALCIAPKPNPQRIERPVSQERREIVHQQKGSSIVYSRKGSESEYPRQESQRSSSSYGNTRTPVNEHHVTRTVVQGETVVRQMAPPNLGQERVHYHGEIPIIENKPYIFDEKGNKIYIDPENLSQYARIAKKAPEGGLINHLPPTHSPSMHSGGTVSLGSTPQHATVHGHHQTTPHHQTTTAAPKSSIVPGTTALVSINGVQTAVKYTQTDDGKLIAIPISNANPHGHITEGIRQSMHKPHVHAEGIRQSTHKPQVITESIRQSMHKPQVAHRSPVIEQLQHVPSQIRVHSDEQESNPIVIHQDLVPRERKHRSKRDRSDRDDRHKHYRSEKTIVTGPKRIESIHADIPEGLKMKYVSKDHEIIQEGTDEKDYSYSSRSRSKSRTSMRSKSKSRRQSKYGNGDSNYHPLKIDDQPKHHEPYYSSSSQHASNGFSSSNYYSSPSYGSKPYDSG